MSHRRVARLNEQLRREVAEILQFAVKDPRIGPVTVTAARVSPDLQQAKLFVAITGSADERSETLAGLEAARPFIRSELAARLDLRRAPELRFETDESLEHARHIERLLGEVLPGDAADEAADAGSAGEDEGGPAADAGDRRD
jgi:ribosome-binding factor A